MNRSRRTFVAYATKDCTGGDAGSWKAPFRFSACIGTMNQIGAPLPALSPQGGERVAEGRERGGSWVASTIPESQIETMNRRRTGARTALSASSLNLIRADMAVRAP